MLGGIAYEVKKSPYPEVLIDRGSPCAMRIVWVIDRCLVGRMAKFYCCEACHSYPHSGIPRKPLIDAMSMRTRAPIDRKDDGVP